MLIVVRIASCERGADEGRDQDQGGEVTPLEDVEGIAGGFEGPKFRRRLEEFPEAFYDGESREDSEYCGRDGQDCVGVSGRRHGNVYTTDESLDARE